MSQGIFVGPLRRAFIRSLLDTLFETDERPDPYFVECYAVIEDNDYKTPYAVTPDVYRMRSRFSLPVFGLEVLGDGDEYFASTSFSRRCGIVAPCALRRLRLNREGLVVTQKVYVRAMISDNYLQQRLLAGHAPAAWSDHYGIFRVPSFRSIEKEAISGNGQRLACIEFLNTAQDRPYLRAHQPEVAYTLQKMHAALVYRMYSRQARTVAARDVNSFVGNCCYYRDNEITKSIAELRSTSPVPPRDNKYVTMRFVRTSDKEQE